MRAIKRRAQPHHMCPHRQLGFEINTHVVNLAFDGVARHSAFGPPFGNHGAQPHPRNWK